MAEPDYPTLDLRSMSPEQQLGLLDAVGFALREVFQLGKPGGTVENWGQSGGWVLDIEGGWSQSGGWYLVIENRFAARVDLVKEQVQTVTATTLESVVGEKATIVKRALKRSMG